MKKNMKLYDVLSAMDDDLPLQVTKNGHGHLELYCIPHSVYRVQICFMSEEETWVNTYPTSPILIPWYDCEVCGVQPSDKKYTLEIWLNDEQYVLDKGWLELKGEEHDA